MRLEYAKEPSEKDKKIEEPKKRVYVKRKLVKKVEQTKRKAGRPKKIK